MPRYSFSIEDGAAVAHPDATEDLANNEAAIERAREIARDFNGSTIAIGRSRVVVRDKAGTEIGDVPLLNVLR
jgi:uncharacterized Zn ribbon protein